MRSAVLRLITRGAIPLWRNRDDRALILRVLLLVLVVLAIVWALPPRMYVSALVAMLAGALVERRHEKRRRQELEHLLILLQDWPDKQ